MKRIDFYNAGSIHDVPIGHGIRFCTEQERFVIFRETYGHCYVFADESMELGEQIFQGTIEGKTIRLPSGHHIDLSTDSMMIPTFLFIIFFLG